MSELFVGESRCQADCPLDERAIVLSHPDFWIANKPSGLGFHDEAGQPGFVSRFRDLVNDDRLFPVHRLDRMTSGLILFARSADGARRLGAQFSAGQIEKYYLALSDHSPAKKQGWVKGGMQKGRRGSWLLSRRDEDLPAVTQFFSFGTGQGVRLFVVRPRTGRTHQIRVALKSLGSAILGDTRYGGTQADRGYLHAYALRFDWSDGPHTVVMPPSDGEAFLTPALRELISSLEAPWQLAWPHWAPALPDAVSVLSE